MDQIHVQAGTFHDVVPFTAGDGLELNLLHFYRSDRHASKGPVLLVHGAGVRANIFCAPVSCNLVDFLLDEGYDVWLENWRASIDIPPNSWTLDEAALYDHPMAVKKVVELSGAESIKAIIHCQGSTSFMMSAVSGLVPEVETIVSNAVSLHTVPPLAARIKLRLSTPIVRLFTRYLNPQWGLHAPTLFAKLVNVLVQLTHHECNNPVCKQVSFTYGVGWPTLWSHANLSDATHEWINHEFKAVPLTFFSQMAKCVKTGHLVAVSALEGLPGDFVASRPQTQARFAFFSGENNRCFLPESQRRTHQYFEARDPGRHSLHLIPGYGHLDVFIGTHAARDVFPQIVKALEK